MWPINAMFVVSYDTATRDALLQKPVFTQALRRILFGFNRPVWQLNTSRVVMAHLRAKEARDAELLSLDALERHSCATLE